MFECLGSISKPIELVGRHFKKLESPAEGSIKIYSLILILVISQNFSQHCLAVLSGVKNWSFWLDLYIL